MDEPGEEFLYEWEIAPVSEVVRRLKQGDTVRTFWRLPDGSMGGIPVEFVTLPNGEESIEVMQRGQPEGYKTANLPRFEATTESTPPPY